MVYLVYKQEPYMPNRPSLGELEELVLLSILAMGNQAYGIQIQAYLNEEVSRNLSRGALHAVLSRLEGKGYLDSEMSGATKIRGGRRKRFFRVTNAGRSAVVRSRDMRNQLWNAIPGWST